jgi:hypothetical protein
LKRSKSIKKDELKDDAKDGKDSQFRRRNTLDAQGINKKKPKFSVNNISNSKRIAIQKKVNAEVLELEEDFADDEDHTPKNK